MADVTIHINETLDEAALHGVADALRGQKGVTSVVSHDDKPHLMVVHFNPDETSSAEILGSVTGRGYHAELLGL